MSGVPTIPFAYAAPAHGSRREQPWAVPEPKIRYRASSQAADRGEGAPHRRFLDDSAPGVRLHLKPGPRWTKQFVAEYVDRFVCVPYRHHPARGQRVKPIDLLVAERDRQPRGYAPVVASSACESISPGPNSAGM